MNILRLIPEAGGETIEISQDSVRVGRDLGSDVHLRDASVSRKHADIQKDEDDWVIVDHKSGNGVLLDGVRTERGVLLPGQRLQLGVLRFRVEIDRGDDGKTVILDRSPLTPGDSTLILGPGGPGVGRHGSGGRASPGLPGALFGALGALAVIAVALLGYALGSRREAVAPPAPVPLAPMATVTPTPPSPVETATATPKAARRAATRHRASLLISADTRAEVFVDGRRIGIVQPRKPRRVSVSPGEHVVRFRVGQSRHDRLVKVIAGEQSVVRYRKPKTSRGVANPSDQHAEANPPTP